MKNLSGKRIIGIALSVIGVLGALFALLFSALRDTTVLVETEVPGKEATFVTTGPGVLDLFTTGQVHISAKKPAAGEILWAVGRTADVAAYLGESSRVTLDALTPEKKAKISQKTAPAQAQQDAKALQSGALVFVESDLWEKSGRAENDLVLDYEIPAGVQRAFIATTTHGTAPDIALTWTVKKQNFPVVQLVILGILVALIGIYVLVTENRSRARVNFFANREARRKQLREEKAGAMTQVLPVFKGNLAAPETAREIQKEHTDGAFGAAILPGTVRTDILRKQRLAEKERILFPAELTKENLAKEAAQRQETALALRAESDRAHEKAVAESNGALGAAIIAGVADPAQYRQRELSPAARIVLETAPDLAQEPPQETAAAVSAADLPQAVTPAESLDPVEAVESVDAAESAESAESVSALGAANSPDSEIPTAPEDDWKQLWNFAVESEEKAPEKESGEK